MYKTIKTKKVKQQSIDTREYLNPYDLFSNKISMIVSKVNEGDHTMKRKGNALPEYAVVVGFVALALYASYASVGMHVKNTYSIMAKKMNTITNESLVTPPPVTPPHCNNGHGNDNLHGKCK